MTGDRLYELIVMTISAVASIFFSYFLLRATINSTKAAMKSADVAERSLGFQKIQLEKEKEEKEFLSKIYLERVKKDVNYVQAAIFGQYSRFDTQTIKNAKQIVWPTPFELVRYFDEEQRNVVDQIRSLFLDYYSKFWFNNDNGDFSAHLSHIEPEAVRQRSYHLGNEISDLIKKL